MITQRIRLDMRPGGVLPVVHVSQYDNDAAALIFDLYDDGELFTVPTGSSVLLNGLKPDNYGFSYQAASISGNTVVCNLTTQMTAVAGAVVCELRVRNGAGTQIVGSCNFILQVEAAALTDDTIISETMIPLIEQAVEIASNLDRYITQTQSNAEIAQEAATTATTAAQSAQIVDANVTGLYNSIEEAKTNANTAAANANTVAANIAAAAARGDYKGDKGDKGDSGITTPVWGMYTMYVDESTGDLWLVTNGEYGSEYWFRYDSETGLLYYCTPDYVEKTVSGELIEITDGADLGALQCKVAFSPIQSGTGDPSPTNIRPISGRTGMTVTRAGKNLIPFSYASQAGTYSGITVTVNDDGTLVLNGTATANIFFDLIKDTSPLQLPTGSYILHKPCATNIEGIRLEILKNGSWWSLATNSDVPLTLTESADIVLYMRIANGTTLSNVKVYPMFEFGTSASAYEPYAGQTYPITWETEAGTVYGGTLDVVSGVLTVTHALLESPETKAWFPALGNFGLQIKNMKTFVAGDTGIYASQYGTIAARSSAGYSDTDAVIYGYSGRNWLIVRDTRYSDVDTFKAGLSGVQIVYPLATPQTYQLTPTEVRTLLGVNNIWSDGDTIEAFTYVSESYDEEG